MGIFDQIINAIDDPNQAATSGQLAGMLGTVQQLGDSYGANPSTVQTALSVVGNYVRSALQQKQATSGYQEAQSVVSQYSGTYPNPKPFRRSFLRISSSKLPKRLPNGRG